MPIPDFNQTRMGQTFYEHHVPKIAKHLETLSIELNRANNLKERELNLKESGVK